jgi:hypothetical protein
MNRAPATPRPTNRASHWLALVEDIQPGCAREWRSGSLVVRLCHFDAGGFQLSSVRHPDGAQAVRGGLLVEEAARILESIETHSPLVETGRYPSSRPAMDADGNRRTA